MNRLFLVDKRHGSNQTLYKNVLKNISSFIEFYKIDMYGTSESWQNNFDTKAELHPQLLYMRVNRHVPGLWLK
jgi:hypothetical protein